MKLFASVLALLSSVQADGQSAGDVDAIVRATLASSAQIHSREPGRPCIEAQVRGIALERMRSDMQAAAERDPREHAAREQVRRGEVTPRYPWMRPSAAPGEWATRTPLDPDTARPLTAALFNILLASDAPPRVVETVAGVTLPAGLRLCGTERGQRALTLSSPVIRGDVAFVETGYVCGGLCGFGLLYALRRTETGWEIVSVVGTWVS